MEPTVVTREIGPLSLRAAFKPGTVDAKARTVQVCWSTGARVLRGFYDRFWEELSLDPKSVRMDRLGNGQAPLLDSHGSYSVEDILGVVEGASVDGKEGTATVRFAKAEDDPAADAIFRKVQDGIISNVSVGYRVHRFEQVEGGEDKIPVMRATDWEPYELSLVGIGADAGAGVRNADLGEANACEFVTRAREEQATMEPNAGQNKQPEKPNETPAADDQVRAAAEAATKAERERAEAIRKLVTRTKLSAEFGQDLVTRGVSIDEARALVCDEIAARSEKVQSEQHTEFEVGETDRQKWLRGAAAGIFRRAMVADMVAKAKDTQLGKRQLADTELEAGDFAHRSFVDLARESLERHGIRTRGMDKMTLLGQAMTFRESFNTTSDFAVLLETVMYKTLLSAYLLTPDTWRQFAVTRPAPDFRVQHFYRNGHFGTLDALTEQGEFKQKAIPDGEKVTLQVDTKGNTIALSRKALVNDDMGAFNDLAARFGRAAALSIEVDVYALLQLNSGLGPTMPDALPFFDASRSNVGVGSALSVEGLDADRVVMASQRDPSGNEILALRPAGMIIPIGLGGTARVINRAAYDPDTSGKLQRPNKVQGLFGADNGLIIDTPRLSGTARYLFADPAIAPCFAVAFLEGVETPMLQTKLGWQVDGTEWKVRIDYGVGVLDWRGVVCNAGVAST